MEDLPGNQKEKTYLANNGKSIDFALNTSSGALMSTGLNLSIEEDEGCS